MTAKEAKQAMIEFMARNKGKSVSFESLKNDNDRISYIMIKTFEYLSFLPQKERFRRAIENAQAHASGNFKNWIIWGDKIMHIANE